MLILYKSILKTSFILLLFTIGGTYLFASNRALQNQYETESPDLIFTAPEDTLKKETNTKEINPEAEFRIPDYLAGKPIDFQVNSAINYLSFSHFIYNESKKIFYQAWLKEKVIQMLQVETDRLRKTYANASSTGKDTISTLILKAEKRIISLNEEIPDGYEKARNLENQYWKSTSADEQSRFQQKIKLFQDSIQQFEGLQNEQTSANLPQISDTIIYYNSTPPPVQEKILTSEIIYKIEIGAFKGKIPNSADKAIQKLSTLRQVENFQDEKGATIYATGKLKQYQEAVILQSQVKQEGIKNASITAYQNGKKITVTEAKKINKEL